MNVPDMLPSDVCSTAQQRGLGIVAAANGAGTSPPCTGELVLVPLHRHVSRLALLRNSQKFRRNVSGLRMGEGGGGVFLAAEACLQHEPASSAGWTLTAVVEVAALCGVVYAISPSPRSSSRFAELPHLTKISTAGFTDFAGDPVLRNVCRARRSLPCFWAIVGRKASSRPGVGWGGGGVSLRTRFC